MSKPKDPGLRSIKKRLQEIRDEAYDLFSSLSDEGYNFEWHVILNNEHYDLDIFTIGKSELYDFDEEENEG